jgi:uncharacterized protein involved in exopolysaccharide biosynthesis
MADTLGSRTLRELARVIFARFWIIIIMVALLVGSTWYACKQAKKHYASSVTFMMREPRPRNPVAREVSSDRSLQVFVKTQRELMTSEPVLARTLVLMQLPPESSLLKEWQQTRSLWQQDANENMNAAGERWAKFNKVLAELDQKVNELRKRPGFREDLRKFARSVEVKSAGGQDIALSEIFKLTVTQPEPTTRAREAAELLAKNYLDRYRELQSQISSNATEMMRVRAKNLRKQRLEEAEKALDQFINEELETTSDLAILEQLRRSGTEAGRQIIVRGLQEEIIAREGELAEANQLQQQILEQLPAKLWEHKNRRDENKHLIVPTMARVDKLADDDPVLTDMVTIIPEQTLKNNVVINQLKTSEVGLITTLNRLKVEYQEQADPVQNKLREIVKTRRQILREMIGEAQALDIQIATLTARQQEIREKLEREQQQLNRVTAKLFRYQQLQNEMDLARKEYAQAASDLASAVANQQQEAEGITISIIENAELPDPQHPAYPQPLLYTLIAAVVGLLLAVAYAFLADHFDHTLNSIEDSERYLGLPVVGSLPRCGSRLVR